MKKYSIICILGLSLLCSFPSFAKNIAIIGAMDSEIELILTSMTHVTKEEHATITFHKGTLHGHEVVVFKSGIGKVNAAIATTIAIEKYGIDTILFTGVAGAVSPKLQITDVVISDYLIEHDYDVTPFGIAKGHVPGSIDGKFIANAHLIQIAQQSAEKVLGKRNVHIGTIVTGDQFIADRNKVEALQKEFNASAVEMEGASVAHVATLYNIPVVVIRAISDKADGSAHMDYKDFEVIAAKNSAKILQDMVKTLR